MVYLDWYLLTLGVCGCFFTLMNLIGNVLKIAKTSTKWEFNYIPFVILGTVSVMLIIISQHI